MDPAVDIKLIDDVKYDTSISRCESERGTYGRGTPPTREIGQSQLDEIFRKLQVSCHTWLL